MKKASPKKNTLFQASTRYLYLSQAEINHFCFYEMGQNKRCKMEEIMVTSSEFCHNHHPTGVKMLAEFIRRGFSV
jgi:hypothetical protein